MNYPVACKSRYSGRVVLFTSEKGGYLVTRPHSDRAIGCFHTKWNSCTEGSWKFLTGEELLAEMEKTL